MSRLSELKKIDALEIVPAISSERPKGCEWNPFQGVKITAYRSEDVEKLVTDMESEISVLKSELRKCQKEK